MSKLINNIITTTFLIHWFNLFYLTFSLHLINYICYKETWILFRDYQSGVSKIIRDAYHYYGVMEFEKKNMETPINDENRHIKLISIAGKKVNSFLIKYIKIKVYCKSKYTLEIWQRIKDIMKCRIRILFKKTFYLTYRYA